MQNIHPRAAVSVEPLEQRSLLSAGSLDPTFGIGGEVENLPGGTPNSDQKTVIALDSKGRVLEADSYSDGRASQTFVTRLNTNGTSDSSFGTDGTFSYGNEPFGNGQMFSPLQFVNQILPEPNGNILLLGSFQIQELNSAGVLNTSFGGGTLAQGPSIPGGAAAGVLLPGGKFMVVDGSSSNIYRFNADGTPDTTFGDDGVETLSSPYASIAIQDIALNAAGQPILSLAAQINSSTAAFATARLTNTGLVDASYGNGGYALAPARDLSPSSSTIAIAPNGAIDQIATFSPTSSSNIFLQAYSANGRSVGGGRFIPPHQADGDSGFDDLSDLAIQTDGKVVAAGSVTQIDVYGHVDSIAVVDRFNAISPEISQAITFDQTFNGSGTLQFPFYGPVVPPEAESVLLDSGGRILAGITDGDAGGTSVARILTAGPTANKPVPLAGTVIGTTGSFRNQGNVAAKAFDGDLSTFFDAPQANGDWVGLNLGTPQILEQVSYAPRPGWAERMVGGMFQGSDTEDFTSDVQTLYTITTAPTVGQLTTIGLGDAGSFQYVRYLGPDGSYGNIAELNFFRAPMALTGTTIGTAGSYENKGNTIAYVFDGSVNTFFDAPSANGGWVGEDLGSAQIVTQVEFAPRDSEWSGYAQRMVGGEIQASNSANFSSGVVTLYTIASAPPVDVLTTVELSNSSAYRYYRYLGPAGSYCNISELEFDG